MEPDLIQISARPEAIHLFQGHTLLITAQDGVVRGTGNQGFYHNNTRLLACWRHLIDGHELQFASASTVDTYSMLAYYLAPHIKQVVPGLKPEEQGLALRVSRFVGEGLHEEHGLAVRASRFIGEGMHEDVDLENYTQSDVNCQLAWEVTGDFADLMEASEGKRQQEAPVETDWRCEPDGSWVLRLEYKHPQLNRAVEVCFPPADPAPCWQDGRVVYQISLVPGQQRHFCVSVNPVFDGIRSTPVYYCYAFHSANTERDEVRRRFLASTTKLSTSNKDVQTTWDRAIADLANLPLYDGSWPEVLTPAAGIPNYQALFGRDVLTTAWQAAMAEPIIMEATLAATARHQGRKRDDFYDEEPGKIVQHLNLGPLATLGMTPFRHYYGDYAAPSDFLIILGQYYAWTGDSETVKLFYDTAERVLDWLDHKADLDGDGFLEYDTRSPKGTKSQGWKDSGLALVYEDGSGVPNPIATCEVQGYLYVGKQQYAVALLGLKRFRQAAQRLREAMALKKRFNEAFWLPEERFIAFALDPKKRQVRSIASNAGHCLATGIVDGQYASAIASRLMAPDMFSGWGVRTLSSRHPSFNPHSYHLGSVWPV